MIRKKTGFWTFIFSLIPGAGEMYLGFFRQGILLMLMFCAVAAISSCGLDVIAIFLPIIWFYSFFHVHNLAGLPDEEFYALEDSWYFGMKQDKLPQFFLSKCGRRIIGILFIIIGCSALWDALRSIFYGFFEESIYAAYIRPIFDYVPGIVLGIAVILFGIWLIAGKKKELLSPKQPKQSETETKDEQEVPHV